jgi:hypothetical protein
MAIVKDILLSVMHTSYFANSTTQNIHTCTCSNICQEYHIPQESQYFLLLGGAISKKNSVLDEQLGDLGNTYCQ